MKYLYLLSVLLCMSFGLLNQNPNTDFVGKYKTEEGKIIIISKVNDHFIGKESSKQLIVLKDVRFEDGKWLATVTNPVKQKTAKAELYLESKRLKIIAFQGMFSKVIYWSRL